jgi:hypothetical protein
MVVKKIILNIILVGVVVFILDFAVGTSLRYFYFKETSGFLYRTTYVMEKTQADLLIFGSSRATHNYVPAIFEDSLKMSYYNTGRDGNGIVFQTELLRSVLKRYTPKLIILDYYGDFKKDAETYDRLSSLLPYYRTHNEVRKTVELRSRFEKIKLLSEVYPFNSDIFSIGIGNLEVNKKRYADDNGYIPLSKEWHAEADSAKPEPGYTIDPLKLNALKEFIELAKNSGAKLAVIYSPIFRKFRENQEIEICKNLCSAENVSLWDYSRDTLFLNNRHLFQDVQHLNNNGATIFSNKVIQKLKSTLIQF